jgi:uncharacterized membrane protein
MIVNNHWYRFSTTNILTTHQKTKIGFATSVSIVLASIISVLLLGFVVSTTFVVGAAAVIASVSLYSQPQFLDPYLAKKKSPIVSASGAYRDI